MGVALALAVFVVGMTPEEEVEAWQPPLAQADDESVDTSQAATHVTTVLAPLGALVVGTATGIVSMYTLNSVGLSGVIAVGGGLFSGIGAFDAFLAIALHSFLPAELPAWTVAVAVVSATVVGAAGLALGVGVSAAYVNVVYAGSDCVCGQDLLLVPVVIGGLTAVGAVAGTTLTVFAAEME